MTVDVTVKYGTNAADYAGRLLSAARALDLPASVVVFSPDGHYTLPEEVADQAGVSYDVVESDEPTYIEGPEAEDLEADQAADDQGEPESEPEPTKAPKAKAKANKPAKQDKVVAPKKGEDGYLEGKGLEAALKSRGLPSEGKADDKRLAVATHDAKIKE